MKPCSRRCISNHAPSVSHHAPPFQASRDPEPKNPEPRSHHLHHSCASLYLDLLQPLPNSHARSAITLPAATAPVRPSQPRPRSVSHHHASLRPRSIFIYERMAAELVNATASEKLAETGWTKNIEICELVAHDRRQARDVVKAIKKRLGSKHPNTQLYVVMLLEMLMNNIGEHIHEQVIDTGIIHVLVKIVKKKICL